MDPWLLMEIDRLKSRLDKINGHREEVDRLRFDLNSIGNASFVSGPMSMPIYQEISKIEYAIQKLEKLPYPNNNSSNHDDKHRTNESLFMGLIKRINDAFLNKTSDEWHGGYKGALLGQAKYYFEHDDKQSAFRLLQQLNLKYPSDANILALMAASAPTIGSAFKYADKAFQLDSSNMLARQWICICSEGIMWVATVSQKLHGLLRNCQNQQKKLELIHFIDKLKLHDHIAPEMVDEWRKDFQKALSDSGILIN